MQGYYSKIASYLSITLLLIQVCTPNAISQTATSACVSGRITNLEGEPLPDANITATHIPSGSKYGASTRADGRYNIPSARVGGPYVIKITYLGYKAQTQTGITLSLGDNATINFTLANNALQLQDVVIAAEQNALINSNRNGSATSIQTQQLERLPTLARSITDFTRLTPQYGGRLNFGGRNNLYNNLLIDGSVFNNNFGLNDLPAGQTNANPISLDAIDQIQIVLSPYDVRQGNFTGAGINATTRSGTNTVSASVYGFSKNQNFVSRKVGETDVTNNNFNQKITGFRLGLPLIKNKFFLFVNAETDQQTEPATLFLARNAGKQGTLSNVLQTELDSLKKFLINKYNYDPGRYEGYNLLQNSTKFLAKIDYNINANNRLSVRWNYLTSKKDLPPSNSNSNGTRANSINAMPFESSNYSNVNNVNSIVAELNTTVGNRAANTLIVGFTQQKNYRDSPSPRPFPLVDIEKNGITYTTFGYEQFSANNKLNQNLVQLSDNLTLYKGKHQLSTGFAIEYFDSQNGFAPNFYGRYRFKNSDDFYNSANNGTKNATLYELQYSAIANTDMPLATLKIAQIGLYAQDEYTITERFKIVYGLRLDMPVYLNKIGKNNLLDTMKFANNETIDVSQFPKSTPLFSPRIGFNFDVFEDKTLQIRGGTGLFTGRIPFVWLSNQVSNTGNLFGVVSTTNPATMPAFTDNVKANIPQDPTLPATTTINATARNFRFPQVWRSNLAVDFKLKYGIIATIEGMFTTDLNAVVHRNANLDTAIGRVQGDGRLRYAGTDAGNRRYDNLNIAIVMDNIGKGYSANATLQLQKTFKRGFFSSIAYNFAPSRDYQGSQSSIANTIYQNFQTINGPNDLTLSVSNFQTLHRGIGAFSYKTDYARIFATTVSVFGEIRSGNRFSYIYAGDMNGDRLTANDLIYIPQSKEQIVLVSSNANDTRTIDQIWTQLDLYIKQDDYLSQRRGQYAQRNGAQTPVVYKVDLRLMQDIFIDVKGKRNTIQVSIDVFNFTNLLNANWGVVKEPNRVQLLTFEGYESSNILARPTFSFPYFDANLQTPLTQTFRNDISLNSRWQAQFGVRYIFN